MAEIKGPVRPFPRIQGVLLKQMDVITDLRGGIIHFMRNDDEAFRQFGEIYFSFCAPEAVKGWHVHKSMTLNYICVSGIALVGLYDARKESPTFGIRNRFVLAGHPLAGRSAVCERLTIPSGIWNAYRSMTSGDAIIANLADCPHDPNEIERMPIGLIEFDWGNYEISG
jgi:dTDP-4-dehydrorhamnose 3,5-epimerase